MNKDSAIKVENLPKAYKLYNAPLERMKKGFQPQMKIWGVILYYFYAINGYYVIIMVAQVADASVYKQTSVAFFLSIES